MADSKISALTAASAAAGANEIPINEAGTNKKVTVTQIATAILPVKATGAEITTGTDDAKFATAKAIADSYLKLTRPTIQLFTSSSGTYTTPAGVTYIKVRMVGGGGGGAGSGTGDGINQTSGGNTTFGTTLLVANGGVYGSRANYGNGGAGGSASKGAAIGIALAGGSGNASGTTNDGGKIGNGGAGGSSPFGGAGASPGLITAGIAAVANTGSGGSGGSPGSAAGQQYGGNGGGAGGYVDAIINSPSATYSYAVGAAGAAGAAGTTGYAGGAGGSGIIIIEEHYGA